MDTPKKNEKAIVKKDISKYNLEKPAEVQKMALVLKKYITEQNLSVSIAGHDYIQVEGWQFAGGLMGLFPHIKEVKELGPNKWMAVAEIMDRQGKVVSVGYALCSKEEYKKKGFDEYALLSMAQTRAIGKAYRNLIGWVIKMSGYQSIPAEEATGIKDVATTPNISSKTTNKKVEVGTAIKHINKENNKEKLLLWKNQINKNSSYTIPEKKELLGVISSRLDILDNQ